MEPKKRQKGIWWFASLGLAIAGGAVILYQGLLWVFAIMMNHGTSASSLGIIGGADGPTAVFVSSAGLPWDLISAGTMLILGIAGCIFFSRKRK